MYRVTGRSASAVSKRFYAAGNSQSTPAPIQSEIDVTKVFGLALLAGVSLYFYRSKQEPVIKTAVYNHESERSQIRNEAYLKKYKTSFIKSFIADKGGIGQKQFRRQAMGSVPQNLIPTHSPWGNQFGAGIKTDKLGPRRERIRYFAPLEN